MARPEAGVAVVARFGMALRDVTSMPRHHNALTYPMWRPR